MNRLEEIVSAKLALCPKEAAEPFLALLAAKLNARASGIILYGSCLNPKTRSESSIPDFYVIVPNYRQFHSSISQALLNWILPPSIFHIRSGELDAKYSIISEKDLARETSSRARDVYHLGRFSKRIAIGWARDESAREFMIARQASAMRAVAQRVYFSLPEAFSSSDLIRQALNLSYLGEFRVEAKDKVDRLYEAEKDYYDAAFGAVLSEMSSAPWNVSYDASSRMYLRPNRTFFDLWGKYRLSRFLRQSRRRAKLRWPKGIITVPNWIDYLLAKIERTHGIKIELTEKERRHIFIYGWKHFFHLKRTKALK